MFPKIFLDTKWHLVNADIRRRLIFFKRESNSRRRRQMFTDWIFDAFSKFLNIEGPLYCVSMVAICFNDASVSNMHIRSEW